MHEKLLARVVIPSSYRILGLDLMPYSLGNELQLFRDDSPFLLLNSAEFDQLNFADQVTALIRAVNVCCRRAPRWFGLWAWQWRPRTAETMALAVVDFRNYLADGRLQFRADLPRGEDSDVRFLGEPEILRLYRFVNAHVPREEVRLWGLTAWDFPYSFAKMLSQGHAEGAGALSIYNVREKTHDDYHRQCELGRNAWADASTDAAKRLAAMAAHPIIRELAGLETEVAEFEKGTQCPA